MNVPATAMSPQGSPSITALSRCLSCGQAPGPKSVCQWCGHPCAVRDGILDAIGPLSDRNRIVAEFYDGAGWVKFRRWEQAFLMLQGGVRRARMEILRHLVGVGSDGPLVLEVGIGSGENLRFVPAGWVVHGVDIARTQLVACVRNHPVSAGRLAWAEAESLPFADACFDACWSVGGFNYFNDHERALREMSRVTRPGGPMVVADELPTFHRAGLGHLMGIPALDAWWLRKLGLDRDFVDMVLGFDVDLTALVSRVWPQAKRHRIWHGMGYCFVNRSGS